MVGRCVQLRNVIAGVAVRSAAPGQVDGLAVAIALPTLKISMTDRR
jgi:hypothetical protein